MATNLLPEGKYQLTTAEAVAALDAIQPDAHVIEGKHYSTGDPEGGHCEADEVLLATVDHEVRDAYDRLVERLGGIWFA